MFRSNSSQIWGLFNLDIRANQQTAEFRLQLRNDLRTYGNMINMYVVSPFWKSHERLPWWRFFGPVMIAVVVLPRTIAAIAVICSGWDVSSSCPEQKQRQFNNRSRNTPQHCAQKNLLLQVLNKHFHPITSYFSCTTKLGWMHINYIMHIGMQLCRVPISPIQSLESQVPSWPPERSLSGASSLGSLHLPYQMYRIYTKYGEHLRT